MGFLKYAALPAAMLNAGALLLVAHLSTAEGPSAPQASSYAPAADLVGQVDFYFDRLSEALASQAEFDLAKQSRVRKDANTVAAILLVLGLHDEPNKYREGAAPAIASARALADGAENYAAAKKALDALKESASAGKGDKLEWGDVAALDALMKQVPVVHASLKRSLEPSRFKKQSAQVAGQSATLAAIAQASSFNTSAVANSADTDKWQRFCAEMRDAAGAMNAAAHAGDQTAAGGAQKRLAKSCDTCHAVFRQE